MHSFTIKEEHVSRQWIASSVFKGGLHIVKKWGFLCSVIFAIVALSLYMLHIPRKFWQILLLPVLPIYIALAIIIFSRLYVLSQTWILDEKYIKACGFRSNIQIGWNSVYEWHVEPIQGLFDYYRLQFKWKKMYGILGGTHSILIPPTIPVANVSKWFQDKCKC